MIISPSSDFCMLWLGVLCLYNVLALCLFCLVLIKTATWQLKCPHEVSILVGIEDKLFQKNDR